MNDEGEMQRAFEHAESHGWGAGIDAFRWAFAEGYMAGTRAVTTGKVRWMPVEPAQWNGSEWVAIYRDDRWQPWPKQ